MKSKITNYLKKQILLIIGLISGIVFSQTPVTYTPGPTNAQINAAIIGNNITITGGALNNGIRNSQIATFTGGNAAGLSMETGAFFSTGLNTELLTVNNNLNRSGNPSGATLYTDADLATIDNTATRDVVSYSFTVTLGPKATTLNVKYQFGSEEYPNYVASAFDDAFGFFVTGPGISGTANLAKLPNGNNTSINKVNYGVPGFSSPATPVPAYDGSQNALYTNNGHNTAQSGGKLVANTNPGPFPIAVQFNGITKLISYTLSGLTPGGTYTFKIIIGDAGDTQYDSGVFINTIYATANVVANNDTYTILSGSTIGGSVLNNDTVNGVSPASLSDVLLTQVSSSSPNVTLNPITGAINVAGGTAPGVYTVTYQICDQTYTANCKTATATITVQINDSDNDGIDNYYDLDDDNDGILDTTENPCTSAQVQWMHNASSGQSDFATFGNDTTTTSPHFTSANNISFGTGLDETTDNYAFTYLLRNATATTFAAAKTGNDYAQVSYTPNKKMYLNGLNFGYYSSTGSPELNCGNFKMAVEYSTSAAFTSPTVLLQDIQVGTMVSGGYTTVNNTINNLLLQSGTTYYFRVYFYDEQNTDPNNRVRLDDLYFPHCLFVDTDNDGIEDYLDLDSDGDGCPDAVEGGDNVTQSMLDGNGRINVAANGTTTPVVVDAQGVPVITNTVSTYNVDGQAQGQTIGQSQINNPAVVAGSVGSNQTIVSGTSPLAITLTGFTGTIQWQSSTDNVTFANISGATSASYSPGTMTATTYYRAVVSSLGGCSVNTNSVVITVVPNTDSDGDGIVDYYDLDDDNDGILDTVELRCDYAPNVYPFTSGNGATKNQLLIFDWSGATLTNVNDTFTTSKIVNGVTYTAKATVVEKINTPNTVTGTGSAVANIINTWAGGGNQMFWRYANYGNTAADDLKGVLLFSLNNAVGNKLSIRFDMTATRSGVNQIFDAIAFDGESTAPAEKGVYTTNASNWTLVDYLSGTPAPTEASISGNQLIYDDTQTSQKSLFAYTRGTNISITGDYTYETTSGRAQAMGVGVWLYCDTDNDGTPNYLDTDSDGDGCPDAIEGSENVKYNQIHDLNLPLADPNYAYRGQIKVTYNGTTTSTPSGIISNSPSANGVPQLLNNAGNNLNASTNPSNLAGTVDNTDGTADIGQGIGDSQDNTINSCKCYKAPSTDGNNYPTQHGITAFNRAGADNQNWPMVRQSGWTALEASTKGFVINRMPVSTSGGNAGEPVDGTGTTPVITSPIAGMMFYDTTNDCLKINVDGTRSGWKCFNNQSCPDEN